MINGYNRTAYCGEFNESNIGQEAVVFGWAQKTRDLGNLIFIDLLVLKKRNDADLDVREDHPVEEKTPQA